jgi:hypothetical protein
MFVWMDSAESYGPASSTITSYLAYRYATVNGTFQAVNSCFGGLGLGASSSGAYLETPALTTNSTLVVGLRFCGSTATTAAHSFLQLRDGTTLGIDVQWDPLTQEIYVYRGTTLLGKTTGAAVTAGSWYFVAIKVLCHATTGTVQVWVSSTSRLSLTAQNTRAGTDAFYNVVRMSFGPTGADTLDQIYILDGSGAVNNDYPGPCTAFAVLYPSADGTVQWTTSSGTSHYPLLAECPPDGTSYVTTSVPAQMDLYSLTNPFGANFSGLTVYGVQLEVTAKELAGGTNGLSLVCSQNGTESDGATQSLTSSYVDYRRVFDTDLSGLAWTSATIASALFGMKSV